MSRLARLRMLRPVVRTLSLPKVGKSLALGNSGQRISGKALQLRRRRLLAAQPLCVHCLKTGKITAAREIDHTVALADGGQDIASNWQELCVECHKTKTALEHRRRVRGDPFGSTDDSR